MADCAALAELLAQLGEEMSESEQLAITRHVEGCLVCQAQMARLAALTRVLAQGPPRPAEIYGHLTDLELADFAARGYAAADAQRLVSHLSQCRACRHELSAVRMALEHFDEVIPGPGSGGGEDASLWQRARSGLRRAWATPRRRACAALALLLFAAECLSLSLAAGWSLLTLRAWTRLPAQTPEWFGMPGPFLVAAAILFGVALRQAAALAWRAAAAPLEQPPAPPGGSR